MMKVLFASSNPLKTSRLTLDEEVRDIQEKAGQANSGKCIEFIPVPAARPDDLLQWLNKHSDASVLHFAGHGEEAGIVLQDAGGNPQEVSLRAVAEMLSSVTTKVRLVFLGACYTAEKAECLNEAVDFVIAMSGTVGSEVVSIFSAAFYRAVGFGRTVWEAFEQGRAAIRLQGLPSVDKPMLYCRRSANPEEVVLCQPPNGGKGGNGNGHLEKAQYDGYQGAMRAVDRRLTTVEMGMGVLRTIERDIAVMKVGLENELKHQGMELTRIATSQSETQKQTTALASTVAVMADERRRDAERRLEERQLARTGTVVQWVVIVLILVAVALIAFAVRWRFGPT